MSNTPADTCPDPVAEDVPDKRARPRCLDAHPARYQWHFRAIPEYIRQQGRCIPNPFRERALYVVHGIGEQRLTETAACMRIGIEDATQDIDPQHWIAGADDNWIVPQPFIYDGFWGAYDDIEKMEPELYTQLTDGEKDFFNRVWKKRAVSPFNTFTWLLNAGRNLIQNSHGITRLYYLYLVPMIWLIVLLSCVFNRRFISGYLNDVRLYIDPRGDMENAIVQRIDRLIAERYLHLLGISPDFTDEPQMLEVFKGQLHQFKRIAWVAHSLGTVISYNVISDLLYKCLAIADDDTIQSKNARRVEASFEVFITLGSPLDKIRFLFPDVLRDWPKEYLPGGARSLWSREGRPKDFWENFHYTSDPVSGRLGSFTYTPTDNPTPRQLVINWHTTGWRIPGLSHLAYWCDKGVLARVLHLSYSGLVINKKPQERSDTSQRLCLLGGALFWAVALFYALRFLISMLLKLG